MSEVYKAILNLQAMLDREYMRAGLKIGLEPDAFFRFSNELSQKSARYSIAPEQYDANEIKLAGPGGPITIVKDESLGSSSYISVATWSTKEPK